MTAVQRCQPRNARPTLASLQAQIEELKLRVAKLEGKNEYVDWKKAEAELRSRGQIR